MNIIDALQGTSEWLAARAGCFTASEAPAMMGASKYQTRTGLLKQKAVGVAEEVDGNKQRLFDRGHAAEADARPLVEAIIGESLYPVTGSLEVAGLPLLASFDGMTAMDDIVWETKLWNASLADAVRAGHLEPHYYWQIEQQLLVSGAEKAYFTTSDGTPDNTVGMWYDAVPGRREQLVAGWTQFAIDLEAYEHVEVIPAAVAAPQMDLPSIMVVVEGKVVSTNLAAYHAVAMERIGDVNTRLAVLRTDQDFADATAEAKRFRAGTIKLKAVKEQALAQTASIDALFKTIDLITAEMDKTSIRLEKAVKADKDNEKARIISEANTEFSAHLAKLSDRVGITVKAAIPRFIDAIKGMSSLDNMREAVGTALRNAWFDANKLAETYERNLKSIKTLAPGLDSLFADRAALVHMDTEPFDSIVINRVRAHQDTEAEKVETAKKAEDARIAAAVEAERKAGEARAAAAIESERMKAQPVNLTAEAMRNNPPPSTGMPTHDQGEKAEPVGETLPAIASTPPEQSSVVAVMITPEVMHKIIIDSGDIVRDFLNAQSIPDRERGRMRAFLMAFVQYQAAAALKVAA